ncbi:MAG: glutathione S-transferase [Cellvibrionaceae bacterium]
MNQSTLIGSPVSLYTGKLRSYLQYKNIPFVEKLSTADVYKNIIIPRTGVRYIPILITDDDEALQDTTVIIDYFEKKYSKNSIYPSSPCQKFIALLFEVYGDEWLVNPAMLYRWLYEENREFAIREFGKTSAPEKSACDQYKIGLKNSGPFAGALPRLGVTTNNQKVLEASYTELLAELNIHFSQYKFLLGSKPSLGDFGLIGPLYAHLYRDPYSGQLMKTKAPHVANWVERMVTPREKGIVVDGRYLDDDEIPDTLFPVISRIFREMTPVMVETIKQTEIWAKENPNTEIPRAIGKLFFEISGVKEERLVFPYNQWMWQRPYDFYHSIDKLERAKINKLLDRIPQKQREALTMKIETPLIRRDNRLFSQ